MITHDDDGLKSCVAIECMRTGAIAAQYSCIFIALTQRMTKINQSDTIKNNMFKMNVLIFSGQLLFFRFKNNDASGGLSSPISICVDKDSVL